MNEQALLTHTVHTLTSWIKSCNNCEQLSLFPYLIETFVEKRFDGKITKVDLQISKNKLAQTVFLQQLFLQENAIHDSKQALNQSVDWSTGIETRFVKMG